MGAERGEDDEKVPDALNCNDINGQATLFFTAYFKLIRQLTETFSVGGHVYGLKELLCIRSSHDSLHWTCWLLRQYDWMLLLPWQHVFINLNWVLEPLLLGRRLAACGALCGKVGETEKVFLGKRLGFCCFRKRKQQNPRREKEEQRRWIMSTLDGADVQTL